MVDKVDAMIFAEHFASRVLLEYFGCVPRVFRLPVSYMSCVLLVWLAVVQGVAGIPIINRDCGSLNPLLFNQWILQLSC
jgi:hypothetical protein